MKRTSRRLSLSRDTLRNLSDRELAVGAGRRLAATMTDGNWPCCCDSDLVCNETQHDRCPKVAF